MTSTGESGSLCSTVESPVRLEPQGPGKSDAGEEWPLSVSVSVFTNKYFTGEIIYYDYGI